MGHDYTSFGMSLDAGSWADWFSGIMSFGAIVIALLGYWIVHRQRIADVGDQEKRVAESIGWKALQNLNDIATVAKHLKKSLETNIDASFQGQKFARVQPLGIPSKSIADLSQEEISLLLKVKGSGVLMDLQDSIARYDSIRFAMQEYKSRHEALYELMPNPIKADGTVMTHHLSKDQLAKVAPYAAMLESLLDSMIDLVADGVDKSSMTLPVYQSCMAAYFKKWHLQFAENTAVADLTIFRSTRL